MFKLKGNLFMEHHALELGIGQTCFKSRAVVLTFSPPPLVAVIICGKKGTYKI